jgi:hypothetical protein
MNSDSLWLLYKHDTYISGGFSVLAILGLITLPPPYHSSKEPIIFGLNPSLQTLFSFFIKKKNILNIKSLK